jgi:hypothetical protein
MVSRLQLVQRVLHHVPHQQRQVRALRKSALDGDLRALPAQLFREFPVGGAVGALDSGVHVAVIGLLLELLLCSRVSIFIQ